MKETNVSRQSSYSGLSLFTTVSFLDIFLGGIHFVFMIQGCALHMIEFASQISFALKGQSFHFIMDIYYYKCFSISLTQLY